MEPLLERVEIVGIGAHAGFQVESSYRKRESAAFQHFFSFAKKMLSKVSFLWVLILYHTISTFNDPDKEGF